MRYLPHTSREIESMLETIGVKSIDDLFSSIPEALRFKTPLNIPAPLSEIELRQELQYLAHQNKTLANQASFIGGGYYQHWSPSAVSQLLMRGEFLTAYTPYQPEVSQGTLQAIYEYQTMVCEILGMDVSNASHYDGSTATAESALMAMGVTKRKKLLVSQSVHPEYLQVLKTYIQDPEISLVEVPWTKDGTVDRAFIQKHLQEDLAGVLVGYPNFFGIVEDFSDLSEDLHKVGAVLVTSTQEPIALGLFKSPGEMGADIAVSEGQSFGLAPSFGGPGLGFFATRDKFVRAIPGRLVGETVDTEGQRGFVLTLATREQHIRREKASSNICTNVALCALAATITMTLLGKSGYQRISQINLDRAQYLRNKLSASSKVDVLFAAPSFNEFVIRPKQKSADDFLKALKQKEILGGLALKKFFPQNKDLENAILVTVTEVNSVAELDAYVKACEELA